MTTYTQISEWTAPLRTLAIGASLAAFILVPVTAPITSHVEVQPIQESVEILTTIPDGAVDQRTLYYSTSHGLSTSASGLLLSTLTNSGEEFESTNMSHRLREISGLPVDILAALAGVSHVGYHKWLNGGGVTSEHIARLTKLVDTFQILRNTQIPNLRAFLETAGPLGKPIDLLISGDFDAVIGLALRSSSAFKVLPTISEEMRRASHLAGRFRPANKLGWNTPRVTDTEREDALDHLSPGPLPNEVIIVDDTDEGISKR